MMKKRHSAYVISVVCMLAFVGMIYGLTAGMIEKDEQDESINAIKKTIEEKALQCYVIEGVYPESLSYLEEKYGLIVNRKDFYVVYEPVAENLPPQIRVVRRENRNG